METASSHRIRKCMLKLLALLIIAFGSTSAHAYLACNIQNGNKVLNAGYLSVPRNATPGQVVTTLPPEPFVMYCTFNNERSQCDHRRAHMPRLSRPTSRLSPWNDGCVSN